MRVTEITRPTLLRTQEEWDEARQWLKQGMAEHRKEQYDVAARNFVRSAKLGMPAAYRILSMYYMYGVGVSKDEDKGFQLGLEAARHGDGQAQLMVGRYYLRGDGVPADKPTGIAWLEAAGQGGIAEACKHLYKIYESVEDYDGEKAAFWRARREEILRKEAEEKASRSGKTGGEPRMPPIPQSGELCQGAEYYYGSYMRGYVSRGAAVNNGKLYYRCKDEDGHCKLCQSNLDGSEARVLADIDGYEDCRLAVTAVSAFVYQETRNRKGDCIIKVKEVRLDGCGPREFELEADERTAGTIYAHASSLYYVLHKKEKCYLCVYYAETQMRRILYRLASEITRVYANFDHVVFHAEYKKGDLRESGWMAYDQGTWEVRCLDCSLSPENVMTHPKYYDENSRSYVEDVEYICIRGFDMARNIAWVEQKEPDRGESAICLVAHSLRGKTLSPCPDIPVWHLSTEGNSLFGGAVSYFDGDRMFVAPHYFKFYSLGRDGSVCEWDLDNNGHGNCMDFLVLGDLLLMDGDTYGEKVYRAGLQLTQPLGRSWREVVPPEPLEVE